ncbi:MAG: T9SS type A sorting domain-containing protein, partial [Saprospiraceae bacterium]
LIHPYPNPVSDILYIRVEGGEPLHLRLHDTYGHLATELQFPCAMEPYCPWENPLQLPVRHLPAGMYFLEVVAKENGGSVVRKVVVNH